MNIAAFAVYFILTYKPDIVKVCYCVPAYAVDRRYVAAVSVFCEACPYRLIDRVEFVGAVHQ